MATIFIYDEIGPAEWGLTSDAAIAEELSQIPRDEPILVRVNSPGGSVYHALGIRQLLADHAGPVEYRIDAISASAATIIPSKGDRVEIAPQGRFMIHDPWSMVAGNSAEMRKQADFLDSVKHDLVQIYVDRVGEDLRDEVSEMMAVETLMTAREAVEFGFVDGIIESAPAIAACWRPGIFSADLDRIFAGEPTDRSRSDRRAAAARDKVRRGPSAAEQERLNRMASPEFWKLQPQR